MFGLFGHKNLSFNQLPVQNFQIIPPLFLKFLQTEWPRIAKYIEFEVIVQSLVHIFTVGQKLLKKCIWLLLFLKNKSLVKLLLLTSFTITTFYLNYGSTCYFRPLERLVNQIFKRGSPQSRPLALKKLDRQIAALSMRVLLLRPEIRGATSGIAYGQLQIQITILQCAEYIVR